jgi:tartrate dehydrogenase/decarboxylase/D-malate dehydrogenase
MPTPPKFRIALYPGDGIGPDVIEEAVRVLRAVEQLDGSFSLDLETLPWGMSYWRETGRVVPDDFLEQLRRYDAILLGAVGWPAVLPDHVTLAPLVQIRQTFDQYACVRPSRLYPGVKSVLADVKPGDVDLVVIRENSEGEYVDNGGRLRRGTPDEVAWQTAVHSRRGIERVLRYGFQLARRRRSRLTMITKSNALRHAYGLWDEVLAHLAPQFSDVQCDRQHCDAALMNLVRCPQNFDVIVASNLFGDLLTDLAGVVGGGLGLAPSANLNPGRVESQESRVESQESRVESQESRVESQERVIPAQAGIQPESRVESHERVIPAQAGIQPESRVESHERVIPAQAGIQPESRVESRGNAEYGMQNAESGSQDPRCALHSALFTNPATDSPTPLQPRRPPSMFEPVHGSAPDIAGRGIANPIAAIRSAAMMLDHLGLESAASRIERAVERTLAQDKKTPDLGGKLTTQEMGTAVLANLKCDSA